MPKNEDTLLRQWHMLRLVPRYPQKVTVQSIRQSLQTAGFEVTERTIQRDLGELSEVFPMTVDDREKPYGWSWQKDARSFDLPGITIAEALTWVMAEQHLSNLMPGSVVDNLRPYFKTAHQRLDSEPNPHRARSWLDKVRTVPPAQPLIPPQIDEAVQGIISEALFREKQVEIVYRRKGTTEPVTYRIHPMAWIQRGPLLYLYARIFDYADFRTLAMHRIDQATILDDDIQQPEDFNLDDKINRGIWGFGEGDMTQIRLKFSPGFGDHLLETPLSLDQSIEELEGGSLLVSATVAKTKQLHWWILGFGNGVEVLEPPEFRALIAEDIRELATKYGLV